MSISSGIAWRLGVTLLALAAMACGGSQVQFQIQKPAAINVKKYAGDDDPTVTVAEWETAEPDWAAHAKEIDSNLRDIIGQAKVVELVAEDGAVTLHAKLTDHGFEEEVTEEKQTCQKAEGKQIKEYACTSYTRKGRALVRVSLEAVDRDGATILHKTETCEADSDKPPEEDSDVAGTLGGLVGGMLQGVTAGVANPDSVSALTGTVAGGEEEVLGEPIEPFPSYAPTTAVDNEPEKIDWNGVLRVCRKRIARQLAKLVVPYKVKVSKPWLSCGDGDEQCEGALVQLQAGNYDRAKKLLETALGLVENSGDADAVAGVHWGLALVYTAMADFENAKKELDMCINLQPTEELFANELKEVKQREKEHAELLAQGAAGGEPSAHKKKKKDDDEDEDEDEEKTDDEDENKSDDDNESEKDNKSEG